MRHQIIGIFMLMAMALSPVVQAQTPSSAVNHEYVNDVEHGKAIFQTKSNGIYVFKVSEPKVKELQVKIPYDDDKIELYNLSAIDWYGQELSDLEGCAAHLPSKVQPSKVVIVGQSAQTMQEIPFEYQDERVSFTIPQSATYGLVYDQESASVLNKHGINDQYIQANYHDDWLKVGFLCLGSLICLALIKYLPHPQGSDKLDI